MAERAAMKNIKDMFSNISLMYLVESVRIKKVFLSI